MLLRSKHLLDHIQPKAGQINNTKVRHIMNDITLYMAAKEFFDRLRGKRTPKGNWINGLYFYPCPKREHEKCCIAFEPETERKPIALWEHCKSIEHVAHRYQVDPEALEETINQLIKKG
ncbi:hypothetical protein CGH50_24545, partial [Vibrio parahaemolyticus]